MDANGKEFSPHIALHIYERQVQVEHPPHPAALATLVNLATLDGLANLKRSRLEVVERSGAVRYYQVSSGTLRSTPERSASFTIQASSSVSTATTAIIAIIATTAS